MHSTSVPCGTSVTSISPAIILACVSGFSPMCEATRRATAPARISLPMPRPGIAVSLAMTVRPRTPRATIASIRRFGVPTPMKPPMRTVAPSGIIAAATSARIAVFMPAPCFAPHHFMTRREKVTRF